MFKLIILGLFLLSACKKKEEPKILSPEELRTQIEAKFAKMSDAERWMYRTKNTAATRFQLKGKVATMAETITLTGLVTYENKYTFDTEGRLIGSRLKQNSETIDTTMTITENRIVTLNVKKSNTTNSNLDYTSNVSYKYNTFGNFESIIFEDYEGNLKKTKEEIRCEYINDTLLTKKSLLTYKDDWSRIDKSIDTLYVNRKIDKITVVEYGLTIEDVTSFKVIQYTYNKAGNLESVEEKVEQKTGRTQQDAVGNPVALEEYTYDTHGNWIEKKQWNYSDLDNKELGRITKRDFTYHP